MKTIRSHVFETNSSSMHSMTYSPNRRSIDEFPVPDADGILHVELKRYWECGVEYDPSSLADIIEYLCAQSVFSSTSWKWETGCSPFDQSHAACLELLQDAYNSVGFGQHGLPALLDFKCFTRLSSGNKMYITKNTLYQWYSDYDIENECDVDTSLPKLMHRIGVTSNCLSDDDFISAFSLFGSELSEYYRLGFEPLLTLLVNQCSLDFWHS